MSNVKLCILKLLSSSYCNNWLLILTRTSIFLLICNVTASLMRSKIQMEIILILRGDLWHFTPFFGCCFKCFYQLSQMKTNWSIIPSPISKPIRTFLDWVTTFQFARFVHTQCKHRFRGYLFTLHKDSMNFQPHKSFS